MLESPVKYFVTTIKHQWDKLGDPGLRSAPDLGSQRRRQRQKFMIAKVTFPRVTVLAHVTTTCFCLQQMTAPAGKAENVSFIKPLSIKTSQYHSHNLCFHGNRALSCASVVKSSCPVSVVTAVRSQFPWPHALASVSSQISALLLW